MKLKKWLMISYIFVMLIPILTGGLLYKWIQLYNQKKELTEYITVIESFEEYDKKLQNIELYLHPKKNLELVKSGDENRTEIVLYDKYGGIIYSSSNREFYFAKNKKLLYKDLYELKHGYRADSLKKPVFFNNEVIGFYEITTTRNKFIKGINNITILCILIFAAVFVLVYVIVVKLVDRKLNTPIKLLTESMQGFAKEEKNTLIDYKKDDEIGELIDHFENMKKEIEERKKEQIKTQKNKEYMIAAISHDLKTPLTSIRAYAESILLCSELSKEKKHEYASIIISKSDYMKNMLDNLLTFTLISSNYKLDFVKVDGQEFFEMLFSGYDELCNRNNIKLNINIRVNGMYEVDVKNMIRVIDNLISNAVRYSNCKGNIWIGAFSKDVPLPNWINESYKEELDNFRDKGVVILVKNQGSTIPKKEQKKIFTPFYQTDDSRNKTSKSGTGLGLSIVNIIIKKHRGKVKVYSEKNTGTVIACWIKEVKP